MYFILRLTQLIVRLDSRLGVLRYKIAPKCLLPGPFGHSGVGRNPGVEGTVRSYNLAFTYPCQGGWTGLVTGIAAVYAPLAKPKLFIAIWVGGSTSDESWARFHTVTMTCAACFGVNRYREWNRWNRW